MKAWSDFRKRAGFEMDAVVNIAYVRKALASEIDVSKRGISMDMTATGIYLALSVFFSVYSAIEGISPWITAVAGGIPLVVAGVKYYPAMRNRAVNEISEAILMPCLDIAEKKLAGEAATAPAAAMPELGKDGNVLGGSMTLEGLIKEIRRRPMTVEEVAEAVIDAQQDYDIAARAVKELFGEIGLTNFELLLNARDFVRPAPAQNGPEAAQGISVAALTEAVTAAIMNSYATHPKEKEKAVKLWNGFIEERTRDKNEIISIADVRMPLLEAIKDRRAKAKGATINCAVLGSIGPLIAIIEWVKDMSWVTAIFGGIVTLPTVISVFILAFIIHEDNIRATLPDYLDIAEKRLAGETDRESSYIKSAIDALDAYDRALAIIPGKDHSDFPSSAPVRDFIAGGDISKAIKEIGRMHLSLRRTDNRALPAGRALNIAISCLNEVSILRKKAAQGEKHPGGSIGVDSLVKELNNGGMSIEDLAINAAKGLVPHKVAVEAIKGAVARGKLFEGAETVEAARGTVHGANTTTTEAAAAESRLSRIRDWFDWFSCALGNLFEDLTDPFFNLIMSGLDRFDRGIDKIFDLFNRGSAEDRTAVEATNGPEAAQGVSVAALTEAVTVAIKDDRFLNDWAKEKAVNMWENFIKEFASDEGAEGNMADVKRALAAKINDDKNITRRMIRASHLLIVGGITGLVFSAIIDIKPLGITAAIVSVAGMILNLSLVTSANIRIFSRLPRYLDKVEKKFAGEVDRKSSYIKSAIDALDAYDRALAIIPGKDHSDFPSSAPVRDFIAGGDISKAIKEIGRMHLSLRRTDNRALPAGRALNIAISCLNEVKIGLVDLGITKGGTAVDVEKVGELLEKGDSQAHMTIIGWLLNSFDADGNILSEQAEKNVRDICKSVNKAHAGQRKAFFQSQEWEALRMQYIEGRARNSSIYHALTTRFELETFIAETKDGKLTVISPEINMFVNGLIDLDAVLGYTITATHLAIRDSVYRITVYDLKTGRAVEGLVDLDARGGFEFTATHLALRDLAGKLTVYSVKYGKAVEGLVWLDARHGFKLTATHLVVHDSKGVVTYYDLAIGKPVSEIPVDLDTTGTPAAAIVATAQNEMPAEGAKTEVKVPRDLTPEEEIEIVEELVKHMEFVAGEGKGKLDGVSAEMVGNIWKMVGLLGENSTEVLYSEALGLPEPVKATISMIRRKRGEDSLNTHLFGDAENLLKFLPEKDDGKKRVIVVSDDRSEKAVKDILLSQPERLKNVRVTRVNINPKYYTTEWNENDKSVCLMDVIVRAVFARFVEREKDAKNPFVRAAFKEMLEGRLPKGVDEDKYMDSLIESDDVKTEDRVWCNLNWVVDLVNRIGKQIIILRDFVWCAA